MSRRRKPPAYASHSSGQARVRIDGVVHYLGPYGADESHREYAKLVAKWHAGSDAKLMGLTIAQLTVLYLQHCETHYRKHGQPTSEVQSVKDTLKRLNKLFRSTPADEFTPRKLKAVRDAMIAEGLARTTINGAAGRIRRMFRWAVGDELVPASVLTGLQAVRDLQYGRTQARETEPVLPVPDAFVDAALPHLSRPVRGIIEFMRATGCRPGEALIVRGCDLNMTGEVWEYRPSSHKTEHHGKGRVVMVGPAGQKVLRAYLRPDLQAYLFCPRDAVADVVKRYRKGAKMRSRLGERYTLHSLAAALKRACIKADVPHWTANQLRHNFATKARREFGIEAARVTLGHSSAVTSEIYAERDMDAARAVVAKIG